MRRFILLIIPLLLLPALLAAQEQPQTATASRHVVSAPRSEWLGSFSGIDISGNLQLKLIKTSVEEAPHIRYDTQGETGSKFRTSIDKNGILKIEEPVDSKRTTVTQVTLWCNDIVSLRVAGADIEFDNAVAGDMFDLEITGGANVQAKFDVADLAVTVTGRSSLTVEGSSKYLRLEISTGKFDGADLLTVSSVVDASHTSEVLLSVSERLEAATSTSAKISYKGSPRIIRAHTTLFGGEISAVE